MARVNNGVFGTLNGKIGAVIFRVVNRKNIASQYQPNVANPQTPAQMVVRQIFSQTNQAVLSLLSQADKKKVAKFKAGAELGKPVNNRAMSVNLKAMNEFGSFDRSLIVLSNYNDIVGRVVDPKYCPVKGCVKGNSSPDRVIDPLLNDNYNTILAVLSKSTNMAIGSRLEILEQLGDFNITDVQLPANEELFVYAISYYEGLPKTSEFYKEYNLKALTSSYSKLLLSVEMGKNPVGAQLNFSSLHVEEKAPTQFEFDWTGSAIPLGFIGSDKVSIGVSYVSNGVEIVQSFAQAEWSEDKTTVILSAVPDKPQELFYCLQVHKSASDYGTKYFRAALPIV